MYLNQSFQVFLILFLFLFLTNSILTAQSFDGDWSIALVTDDDNVNGTNQRTMAVAATTGENNFVSLVSRPSTGEYYLVGYKNATDSTGRLGASYSGATDPAQTLWRHPVCLTDHLQSGPKYV